jgi:hypothetical protein
MHSGRPSFRQLLSILSTSQKGGLHDYRNCPAGVERGNWFRSGASFNWYSRNIQLPLAILAAIVLQRAGFGPLPGIATVAACLSVNQIAFVVMEVTLAHTRSEGKASRRGGA